MTEILGGLEGTVHFLGTFSNRQGTLVLKKNNPPAWSGLMMPLIFLLTFTRENSHEQYSRYLQRLWDKKQDPR
ncbi:MAG: hypothetical protein R3297_10015 [Desulfobulbales bacterium]|nr:hypothetical protein [Desulfobulbales bacterium]